MRNQGVEKLEADAAFRLLTNTLAGRRLLEKPQKLHQSCMSVDGRIDQCVRSLVFQHMFVSQLALKATPASLTKDTAIDLRSSVANAHRLPTPATPWKEGNPCQSGTKGLSQRFYLLRSRNFARILN